MRDQMLERFRGHLSDMEKGYFETPHRRQPGNQIVMISKQDFYCGGQPVPSYYIEFDVHDARPVDVFNVIADTLAQPHWLCTGCTISLVKNDLEEKVQGFAAAYSAPPVNRREFYQWQAYEANFTGEEFIVGAEARHAEVLKKMKAPESDATVGRMCMSFSHIRRNAQGGARVTQMNHFDAHQPFSQGMFSPRNIYHLVWPLMLQRVPKIIMQSQAQFDKSWEADRLAVPNVFIKYADNASAGHISARHNVLMPRVGTVAAVGAAEEQERAALLQKRMPLIILGSVLLAICCSCGVIGICVYCGACTSCLPATSGRSGSFCFLDDDDEEEEDAEEDLEEEVE